MRKSAFFSRIDNQIILILLLLMILLSLLVSQINKIGLYNAYKTNITDWVLFTNKLIGVTIDAGEIKYYADLMLAQDEEFKKRQKQFYHDRENYLSLLDANAPAGEQEAALAKMNEFLDVVKVHKTKRYWDLVEKFRDLKRLGHAKFLYVFMDAGLTDEDGTTLYPYIVDADDSEVYASYDNDGFGTVTTQGDEVQQIYATKKPLSELGEYDGGYGKLYFAHAPIMDSEGNIIAILGTDIDIAEMYGEISRNISLSNLLFFACFISLILTVYFFLRASVTSPVRKLTEAIQNIAEGKILTPVPASVFKTRNEISILAIAINDLHGVFKSVVLDSKELGKTLRFGSSDSYDYAAGVDKGVSAHSVTGKIETYIDESKRLLNILKNILNGLDAMVFVSVPETGEIIFLNQAMKANYNLGDDSVGQICYKILQQGVNERCSFCPCHELDKDPKKIIVWERLDPLTNRIRQSTDRYIEWPGGAVVHLQHSVDITDLIEAKEEAIRASAAKSKFLARISHEIRTPMNAVFGIAEMYMQEDLPPEISDAFSRIYQSASMLLGIINELLDLSKIEAGKMELFPCRYEIASLIQDAVQLNIMYIGGKPIEFKLRIDPDIPAELFGDFLRIKQILNNLLSNAFKYTKEGFVSLDVTADFSKTAETAKNVETAETAETVEIAETVETADDDVVLVFSVRDSGSGMSPEQVQVLCNEYTRFNFENIQMIEGTGLGMNITKRLVEMMNGSLCITSELDKGSEFTVRLPQKSRSSEKIGKDIAENLRKFNVKIPKVVYEPMPYGRVLIVDDLETNLFVAKGLMAPYKLQIHIAGSGIEALDKINDNGAYDIVFMDQLMPVMDGIETVHELREKGWKGVVIALTANALVGQEEMFKQNGFDGYISKPININDLDILLKKYIRDKQPPEVIRAALNQSGGKQTDVMETTLSEVFIQDAKRILAVMENVGGNSTIGEKEAIQAYLHGIHALKGALASIGKTDLSAQAAYLEESAKTNNIFVIRPLIQKFMILIRELIADLTPKDAGTEYSLSARDTQYLHERLRIMRDASKEYDVIVLNDTLDLLRKKTWPISIKKLLSEIAECILHSKFEDVIQIIDSFG